MQKQTRLLSLNFNRFKMIKRVNGITFVELMTAMIISSVVMLSFYSLQSFSRGQVTNSEKRAKLQGELALTLEQMSKYVQQSSGDVNNPPIKLYPDAPATPTGFQVRYDCQAVPTPLDLTDDVWVHYTLSGNQLSTGCATAACTKVVSESLSNKIIAGFSNGLMPANPGNGFYVMISSSGSVAEIGLVGRYDPLRSSTTQVERSANPQVEIKTKLICNNSSTN